MYYLLILCNIILIILTESVMTATETVCDNEKLTTNKLNNIITLLPPELDGKSKGDSGKICVIGGSTEYSGAPYFAAASALKVGADLIYVVTTEGASPIIKSYSPDLIVYPYLNIKSASKISDIIKKSDIIVVGPGLGREDEAMSLTYDIINTCKTLQKPLVIDADGLFAVSKNPTILKNYPSPGVIMTPNRREANKLMQIILTHPNNTSSTNNNWYGYWGKNVSVLVKGEKDEFYAGEEIFNWSSSDGGSGRRAAGQGDILSGALGTLFNWALKSKLCNYKHFPQLPQSAAVYAAAKLTRSCNSITFAKYGRSMTASNMIENINFAFQEVFGG